MLDDIKEYAKTLAAPIILTAGMGTMSCLFLQRYANGKGMTNANLLRGTAEYLSEYDGKAQNVSHYAFDTVEFARSKNSHIDELNTLSRDLEERLASGQAMDTKELGEKMRSIVRQHDVGGEELAWGIGTGILALIGLAGTAYSVREILKDYAISKRLQARLSQNEQRFLPDEIAKIRDEQEEREGDSP